MSGNAKESMRTYWDEAARTSAALYVDTRLSFDHPDLDRFFETGRGALATGGMELRQTKGLDTLYAWAWAVRR